MYKGDLQNYNLFKVKTSINKKLTLFKYTFVQPNSKYKNMKRKYINTTFNNRLVHTILFPSKTHVKTCYCQSVHLALFMDM